MIHSATTLLRACVENNGESTQQHGPAQDFHPFMTNLSSSVQCLRLAGAISNHLTTLPPCTWGMLQNTEGKPKWIGIECACMCSVFLCASVTEMQRVGTCSNRKPWLAFTWEEFPVCKMCIAAFSTVEERWRGEEGGRKDGKWFL